MTNLLYAVAAALFLTASLLLAGTATVALYWLLRGKI